MTFLPGLKVRAVVQSSSFGSLDTAQADRRLKQSGRGFIIQRRAAGDLGGVQVKGHIRCWGTEGGGWRCGLLNLSECCCPPSVTKMFIIQVASPLQPGQCCCFSRHYAHIVTRCSTNSITQTLIYHDISWTESCMKEYDTDWMIMALTRDYYGCLQQLL